MEPSSTPQLDLLPSPLSTSEWIASESIAELPVKAAATNFVTAIATLAPMAAKIVLFADELKHRLQREHDGHKKPRPLMLYLLASSQAQTRPKVACLLGVHHHTIGRWLAMYAPGGLEALLATYIPAGKPVSLAPEVLASLERALHAQTRPNKAPHPGNKIAQHCEEKQNTSHFERTPHFLANDHAHFDRLPGLTTLPYFGGDYGKLGVARHSIQRQANEARQRPV